MQKLYDYLKSNHKADEGCLIGFKLKNTVSEFGAVTRGVCTVENNELCNIEEVHKIKVSDGEIACSKDDGNTWIDIDKETIVSMNMWDFLKK